MDLECNPPKFNSIYSPSRGQVSPIWAGKDKGVDDQDAAIISDGEDQSSGQGNDVENNMDDVAACNDDELNDALVWHDGIGTLAGSDLKFRMNATGDIELIIDDCKLDCNDVTAEDDSDDKTEETVSHDSLLPDAESPSNMSPNIPLDAESSQLPETSTPDEEHKFESVDFCKEEKTEEFSLFDMDPVLEEDMAMLLYDDNSSNDSNENISAVQQLQDGTVQDTRDECAESLIRKCEICGRALDPNQNRFCTRVCLGRHAASSRTLRFGSKKRKAGRKKRLGKVKKEELFSPHPDDIMTVIQDKSSGDKNELKIKIRWSSSVNESIDPDYSHTERKALQNATSATARGSGRRFSWESYLAQESFEAAPVDAFSKITGKEPFPGSNPFQVGMSLEGVDPENEALICPLFVAEVHGFRIRLSFYAYSETYDFWRNADCPLIFPCGFCKETNRMLRCPKESQLENWDWDKLLDKTKFFPAPREYFMISKNQTPEHNFKIGQKLEAVDKHNPSLVCVASISDIIGDQLLISFDGWSDQFNFWCSTKSQLIHRVDWCKDQGIPLTVPRGWDESVKFQWGKFLEKTLSQAVDVAEFSDKQEHDFVEGMKLEVVDPRNKILIRAATIIEIKGFQVKIHFDGWSDVYDFWTFLEDSDLHPTGWCKRTDHHFEPPIFMDDDSDRKWQNSGCPIPGCSGIGHIKGAKFHNHYSEFGCPYSPQNIAKEPIKNRLSVVRYKRVISNDKMENFAVEQLAQPTGRVGRPRKRNSAVEKIGRVDVKKTRRHHIDTCEYPEFNGGPVLQNTDIVSRWSVEEVGKFVEEVTNEPCYGKIFQREEMDGRALLMLTQAEILTIMNIKLGPAVKIYHAILNIKADS